MSRSNPLVLADIMGPFKWGAEVTPDDATDLPGGIARGLYIGVAGNLSFIDGRGNAFDAMPVAAGVFPFEISRVKETDTTAQKIIAGY